MLFGRLWDCLCDLLFSFGGHLREFDRVHKAYQASKKGGLKEDSHPMLFDIERYDSREGRGGFQAPCDCFRLVAADVPDVECDSGINKEKRL